MARPTPAAIRKARIARQRAVLARLITPETAQAWAVASEKYAFCIDLCDQANVPNSHWSWLEVRLAKSAELGL
jgi:hypothetical protein